MVLFWVDDAIFYSKTTKSIDDVILSLKDELLLEKEEDMAGFLGIQLIQDKNNSLIMNQIGLIEMILSAMDMEDCNHKNTPEEKNMLYKDVGGAPCCEYWYYRSIVGMMLYLAGSNRPDIAYAVHQCARFSYSAKQSNGIGIKHIVRYLKGTQTKGIIMTPY